MYPKKWYENLIEADSVAYKWDILVDIKHILRNFIQKFIYTVER